MSSRSGRRLRQMRCRRARHTAFAAHDRATREAPIATVALVTHGSFRGAR
ncbi:hypothetical protein A7982_12307 [Minicystis rosea]|nr:hypothetical protein A7982_12307 [Minicystis rosea]